MKIKVIVILILLFSAFVITANLAGFHLYPSFYDYKPKLGGQNYEALVTSEKLGGFAQSKPPGQVLFYVLYFLVLFLLAAGSLAAAVLVDLDEIQWANIKIVIKNRQGAVFTMVCLLQFALVFAIKVTHDF